MIIVIKYDRCVIQIWKNANLTEIPISRFRKLLKLAKDGWNNEPVKIKMQLLEMLEREERETQTSFEQARTKREITYFKNKLKKIEKMKSEVCNYV